MSEHFTYHDDREQYLGLELVGVLQLGQTVERIECIDAVLAVRQGVLSHQLGTRSARRSWNVVSTMREMEVKAKGEEEWKFATVN